MEFDFSKIDFTGIAINWGMNILFALAIYIIGKIVAKLVCRLLRKVLTKANTNPTLSEFLIKIVYGFILCFVILASLSKLGIQTTSFVAIIGAVGLAIGLAFKDSLSNLASGVLLIVFRRFEINDYIACNGIEGKVKEIDILSTKVTTSDNRLVIVPNTDLITNSVTNFTANKVRRVDLVFGCGYEADLKKVKKILSDIVQKQEKVLKSPEALIAVSELADSSVNFVVRPWAKTVDYWQVYYNITEQVKLEFDKQGISIPYPQQELHLHTKK